MRSSTFPFPVLSARVGSMTFVATDALRTLLALDDVRPDSLAATFEVTDHAGWPLVGPHTPWNRALRGEPFDELELWHDRRDGRTLLVDVRSRIHGDEVTVSLEDTARNAAVGEVVEILEGIDRAVFSGSDPATSAQAALKSLTRVLRSSVGLIVAPVRDDEEFLETLAETRPLSTSGAPSRISFESGDLLATVARERTMREIRREDAASRSVGPLCASLFEAEVSLLVVVPLVDRGVLVGVAALGSIRPGRMTDLERRALRAVAETCAAGLGAVGVRHAELRVYQRLRNLREVTLELDHGPRLRELLRRLVHAACEHTGALYGALGVLAKDRQGLSDFVYVGIPEDEAKAIGHLPEGRGLLGAVIREGRPVRVANIAEDDRAAGFPRRHPHMKTFLGVPLRIGDEVFGNFYLTNKAGGAEFTVEDELWLELLSGQASLLVSYAREVEDLDEKLRFTEAALECTRDVGMVFFSSPAGAVTFRNHAADRLLGRSLTETTAQQWVRFGLRRPDGREFEESKHPALRALGGEEFVGEELLVVHSDGSRLALLASATPVRSDRGNLRGAVLILQNLSESRRAARGQEERRAA